MKKLISMLLLCAMAMALVIPTALADTTMYVYTENGKPLNVRSSEKVSDNIIGSLPNGTAVTVRFTYNGWSEIIYPHGESDKGGYLVDYAYVQSRYLVKSLPSSGSNTDTNADAAKALAAMNAQFRTGKKVTAFTVVSRPSRATGWVNLRWAPTTEAEVIAKCYQGKELTVLAELKDWYQVQDPATGMIGFISRQYVSQK